MIEFVELIPRNQVHMLDLIAGTWEMMSGLRKYSQFEWDQMHCRKMEALYLRWGEREPTTHLAVICTYTGLDTDTTALPALTVSAFIHNIGVIRIAGHCLLTLHEWWVWVALFCSGNTMLLFWWNYIFHAVLITLHFSKWFRNINMKTAITDRRIQLTIQTMVDT